MCAHSSSVDQVSSEGYLPIGHKFDKDPPLGTFDQRCVKQVSPEKRRAQGQTPSTSTGKKSLPDRKISKKALKCAAHNEALERCSRSVGRVLGALHVCGSDPEKGKSLLKRASKAHQDVLPDVRKKDRKNLLSKRVEMKLKQLGLEELREVEKGTVGVDLGFSEPKAECRCIIKTVDGAIGRYLKAAASKVKEEVNEELPPEVGNMCSAATYSYAHALDAAVAKARSQTVRVLVSCRLPSDDDQQYAMLKLAMVEYINDEALLPYDTRKLAPPGTPVVTPKLRQDLIDTLSVKNSLLEEVKKDAKSPYGACEESVLELKTLFAKLPKTTLIFLSSGETSFLREAFFDDKGAGKIFKAKYKLLEWLMEEALRQKEVS